MRTVGMSPKVIGPVVTALSAFVTAKVHDPATAALLVAVIGAAAAIASPAGKVASDHAPRPRRVSPRRRKPAPAAAD
jgi:hypothetical protein